MGKIMKLEVVYEDNHIIVVRKPANILTQGDATNDISMLEIIKDYIKLKYKKEGNVFLGLLHRLDRPVSGIMVFARTSKGASRISDQIRRKVFKKTYYAVLLGNLEEDKGDLKDYLYKNKKENRVYVVDENHKDSKLAELSYEVIERKNNMTLVKIDLKTGRPHQIRVQFASKGYPLYGDKRYAKNLNKNNDLIALFSNKIEFEHPTKKEKMEFCIKPKSIYPWNLFDKLK
jgi:23S rRNA pseudouridine1911/1915/1917 synthase